MDDKQRPGIGIDYDGTIADTNTIKAAWIRENLGIKVPPWKTDRTMCVPIIGLEQYERMSRVVYSPEMSMRAPEVPGAASAIRVLSVKYRVYVVTARNNRQIASCQAWLREAGIAEYISGYLSSAERGPDGTRRSKGELAHRYGICVLVDDDERHLRGEELAEFRRILLKHGCNEPLAVDAGIALASSWTDVLRLLGIEGGI